MLNDCVHRSYRDDHLLDINKIPTPKKQTNIKCYLLTSLKLDVKILQMVRLAEQILQRFVCQLA